MFTYQIKPTLNVPMNTSANCTLQAFGRECTREASSYTSLSACSWCCISLYSVHLPLGCTLNCTSLGCTCFGRERTAKASAKQICLPLVDVALAVDLQLGCTLNCTSFFLRLYLFGPGTHCRCASCTNLPADCQWGGGPYAGTLLLYAQVKRWNIELH